MLSAGSAQAQMNNPRVVLIFWGQEYAAASHQAPTIEMVNDLVRGPFLTPALQYGINNGRIARTVFIPTGPSNPAPTTQDLGQLQNRLIGWIKAGQAPAPKVNETNLLYVILPPMVTSGVANSGTTPYFCFCDSSNPANATPGIQGYHWQAKYNNASTHDDLVIAAVKTYAQPDWRTFANAEAWVTGHEMIEAFNDPLGGREELGDPCHPLGTYQYLNKWGVEQYQSDQIGACVKAPASQFIGPTRLKLINGWINAPFSTGKATVEEVSGIVQFQGAIASGSTAQPFVLPAAFAPATDIYIPVDLCNATNGRLHITPSGAVNIDVEKGAFNNAQCFTSLDGASFAPAATGFSNLTLINGWFDAPFSTSNAAVKLVDGIVHFKGAIAGGSTTEPFVLPSGLTPATDVYVPVDLCNATKGRLHITPSGAVNIDVENGAFNNAQCFTSLDGASFALSTVIVFPGPMFSSFVNLSPINGWFDAPFSTSNAAVDNVDGIMRFKGAIAGGSNAAPFVLPDWATPNTDVYIPVDLCDATNGRLHITPSGAVTINAENGALSNAQCFTSLDGASFVP